jgi:FixJ family two-component response regulator
MSGRRADVLDIREMLRQMRLGASNRAIAEAMQASRNTVKKYRAWANEQGLRGASRPPAPLTLRNRDRQP